MLVYAFVAFCIFLMLPKPDFQFGRAFLFFMFGSDVATAVTTRVPTIDILKYVNPLIGTTNGGHVFPGASLPYGELSPYRPFKHNN